MKLLMITGDRALAQGKKGPFYYMLEEFSRYWERIDIICPRISTNPDVTSGGQPFQPFSNVFVHSSHSPLIFHPFFILKKGLEIYKKEEFDIFNIHSYPPFYNDIGGRWLYNKIKVPHILEVMHITGYPKAGSLKEWFYRILTRLFISWSAKRAKIVRIINQKQTLEFLKKTSISEKKIRYLPAFYIDLDIFKPQNIEKQYDIIFASRLVKNKGIFLLLKAIKELKIKLAIIGSGPLEDKIKNYIKKHKLNVDFIGWVPGAEDLAKVYNQSKIMIMPSFNEGGPRVTLEAMACEVAVITSRVGIMLDIIKDPGMNPGQGNGLFINWNVKDITEKISLLLNNEDLQKRIAEAGYKTVQQFERKKVIKNHAETYKNLLHHS